MTAKEYTFPGGRSGDLLFMDGSTQLIVVVEVKCTTHTDKPKKKLYAKKQASALALAMHALYPKNYVVGVIYTYDGFERVVTHVGENHSFEIFNDARKFPWE
jgi:hypothetical protein